MSLESYNNKRDFSRTPEPKGEPCASATGWRFVVQKHAASRLHYDLRLELDGVLLSWAVPKGPSLDWEQKRLSIHVEDHPLGYLEFEGVIPQHEYGGGTVMVWDIGTWQPRDNARADYQAGALKFDLHGEKLQGGWMLKRLDHRGENQWLWIKEKDSAMRETADYDVVTELPDSVLTSRSMEEIAADRSVVWSRDEVEPIEIDFSGFEKAKACGGLPNVIRPTLPTATRNPPTGENWIHEIKHDGYRMLCFIDDGNVRFQSRNGKDWTSKLPSLSRVMAQLPVTQAVFDGEVVVVNEQGLSSFQALQNRIGAGKDTELRYYAFDLLYVNGHQLTACPLSERKEILATVSESANTTVRFSVCDYLTGDGPTVFQQSCKLGMEGIVSKRLDKRYAEGRFEFWLKTKCLQSREFVIGGFTPPTASRKGLGAILLGSFTEDDQLHFLGKVGTGFTHDSLVKIRKMLDELIISKSPFENLNRRSADKGTIWVDPKIIAEVEFGGWTDEELIRFGSFKGLREEMQLADLELYTGAPQTSPSIPVETELAPAQDVQVEPRLPIPEELGQIKISSPTRIVYPDMGITKLGLAMYYAQVGNFMLEHIAGRPISLLRCPGGFGDTCFFQKRAPQGLSDAVERVELPTHDGVSTFLVVNDLVGLLSLIQFGAMEIHVSNARANTYDKPDRMVFDLDPDADLPWKAIQSAARDVRARLEAEGYDCWLKTTGGKGLHVMVPVGTECSWDESKDVSKRLATSLAKEFPKRFTTNVSKRARRGKIYLDVNRNTRGASTIAVFSTRAKRNAPVSVPIDWDELDSFSGSDRMSLQAAMSRLADVGDPWTGKG